MPPKKSREERLFTFVISPIKKYWEEISLDTASHTEDVKSDAQTQRWHAFLCIYSRGRKDESSPYPLQHTHTCFIQEVAVLFWMQSIPTTHKPVIAGTSPIVIFSLSCVAYGGLEMLCPWDVIGQNKMTSLYHLLSWGALKGPFSDFPISI